MLDFIDWNIVVGGLLAFIMLLLIVRLYGWYIEKYVPITGYVPVSKLGNTNHKIKIMDKYCKKYHKEHEDTTHIYYSCEVMNKDYGNFIVEIEKLE